MYYTLKLLSKIPNVNWEPIFSKAIRSESIINDNHILVKEFYDHCHSILNPKISSEEFHLKFKVVIDKYNCEGCECGSLGQLAHMDCPYGCLHDYQDCSFCSLI
jgi:hypothetical protein